MALSLLSHGAAVFSFPLLLVLLVAFIFSKKSNQSLKLKLRFIAISIISFVPVYLPWLIYQRIVDPPGNRLTKWHLAGVEEPTPDLSVTSALVESYGELSFSEWLNSKLMNFDSIFGVTGLQNLSGDFVLNSYELRNLDFFNLSVALIFPIVALVLFLLFSIKGNKHIEKSDLKKKSIILIFFGLFLSVIFWVVAMFTPGSTIIHQGTHVIPLIFIALSVGLLFEESFIFGLLIGILQISWALALYLQPLENNQQVLRIDAVVLLSLSFVTTIVLTQFLERNQGTLKSRQPNKISV
jgi:hypothetical protein